MRQVLFLCTGNYYRSRFAEAVFNHHAAREGLPWRAVSRGLAIHLQPGDLSSYTAAALEERGIDRNHTGPTRVQCCTDDLSCAALVVALYDREHRPMVRAQYPDWEERIRFWSVADADELGPGHALPAIERAVLELLEELRQSEGGEGAAEAGEPGAAGQEATDGQE